MSSYFAARLTLAMIVSCIAPVSSIIACTRFRLHVTSKLHCVAQIAFFVTVVDTIGEAKLFFALSAVGAAAAIFVANCVPETQGKSLEQIEHIMTQPDKCTVKTRAM